MEAKLKAMLGDLIFQNVALMAQIESLRGELEKAKAEAAKAHDGQVVDIKAKK